MVTLKSKWNNFLGMVLDPWFVVFILLTIASLGLSIWFKTNELFSNLLAVAGSITGGIAGGIFQNEHAKSTGEHILRKKGQSAVRNLKSIQTQIASLRTWVIGFSKKAKKDSQVQLEEINRHLATIELNVNSGYEDWIDIDPGLRGEKDLQEKQNEVFRSYASELLDQKLKLIQTTNATEKTALEGKISGLEKQIKSLKKESEHAFYSPNIVTGPFNTIGAPVYSSNWATALPTCSRCGNFYQPDFAKGVSLLDYSVCNECRGK